MKNLILFTLLLVITTLSSHAQSFDDDELPINVVKADEAKIMLNNAEYKISENIEIKGGQKHNIKVNQLKPGSYVTLKFQKAGVKLDTKVYTANHDGQLELEFVLKNTKVSGTAFVEYYASSGKKVEIKAKVKVL